MYSIFDEGLGRLMSAGRNSPTKEAAKEALLHYLSGSCSRDELEALSKLSPDELAARHHYKNSSTSRLTRPIQNILRFSPCSFASAPGLKAWVAMPLIVLQAGRFIVILSRHACDPQQSQDGVLLGGRLMRIHHGGECNQ